MSLMYVRSNFGLVSVVVVSSLGPLPSVPLISQVSAIRVLKDATILSNSFKLPLMLYSLSSKDSVGLILVSSWRASSITGSTEVSEEGTETSSTTFCSCFNKTIPPPSSVTSSSSLTGSGGRDVTDILCISSALFHTFGISKSTSSNSSLSPSFFSSVIISSSSDEDAGDLGGDLL